MLNPICFSGTYCQSDSETHQRAVIAARNARIPIAAHYYAILKSGKITVAPRYERAFEKLLRNLNIPIVKEQRCT